MLSRLKVWGWRLQGYGAEAVFSLWSSPARTLLTVAAMFIGTASIVAVNGISAAARSGIAESLRSVSSLGLIVVPDPNQTDPRAAALRRTDADELRRALRADTTAVEPAYQLNVPVRIGHRSQTMTVVSSGEQREPARAADGRLLSATDVGASSPVAVINAELASRFGDDAAVGHAIGVQGRRFRVVGVLDDSGDPGASLVGAGGYVVLPYSAIARYLNPTIAYVNVVPIDVESIARVKTAAVRVLQRVHGPRAKYLVQDTAGTVSAIDKIVAVAAVAFDLIGGIALLVAGVGVTNIMLVTVSERRREIGLRRAIGATNADILLQFLLEALSLSVVGALVGTLLGAGVVAATLPVLSRALGPLHVPWGQVGLSAAVVALGVGTFFGLYPAYRATRVRPIEALR